MQESLMVGVRVVVPLIIYMGLGYVFRVLKIAGEQTFRELNKVCFRSFMPVLLFNNIYQSDLSADFEPGILIYGILTIIALFGIASAIVSMVWKENRDRSVIIQGLYRSNFALYGMAVTRSVCGDDQLGMATILVAVIVPVFNVLAVLLFNVCGDEKKSLGATVAGILKNPLIIGSVLGILVSISGLQLPDLACEVIETMSDVSTPVVLLCLGGTFAFDQFYTYRKELATVVVGRLVIVPLLFVTIAAWIGIRGSNLVALMVMYGSPTAAASYAMASEMGGNRELAASIVVATSVLSVLTIFLWVVTLNTLGLIS